MEINGKQQKIVEDHGRSWKIMEGSTEVYEIARNVWKKGITNDYYMKKSI